MKTLTTDIPTVIGFFAALAIVWLPGGIVHRGLQSVNPDAPAPITVTVAR